MPVSTREDLIKILQKENPKEPIYYFLLQKEYFAEDFNNNEYTDENDDLLEVKKEQITDHMAKEVFYAIENSDGIFERFNDYYDEIVKDVICENLFPKDDKEETELWEQ